MEKDRPAGRFSWPPGKKVLRKLGLRKYRQDYGLYLLEGAAAIEDALRFKATFHGVLFDERVGSRPGDRAVLSRLGEADIPLHAVDTGTLEALSGLSTPPPLVALLEIPEPLKPSIPPVHGLTLALDRVNDPGNVGTLLRAAAFYRVSEVWLGKGTAELYNPKTLRAAMAAHLHLKIAQGVDLAETVAAAGHGVKIIASVTGEDADPPRPVDTSTDRWVLLLGSEAHGLAPDLVKAADRRVAIPRTGPIDSLNVAMAGTVLLDRLLRS